MRFMFDVARLWAHYDRSCLTTQRVHRPSNVHQSPWAHSQLHGREGPDSQLVCQGDPNQLVGLLDVASQLVGSAGGRKPTSWLPEGPAAKWMAGCAAKWLAGWTLPANWLATQPAAKWWLAANHQPSN